MIRMLFIRVLCMYAIAALCVMPAMAQGDSISADALIRQVKTAYAALQEYSDSAFVQAYHKTGELRQEANFEINWKRIGAFKCCWHSALYNFPLVFTEACISSHAQNSDSITHCVNNADKYFRSQRDSLERSVARFSGTAGKALVLLKLLFADQISSRDYLSGFHTSEVLPDTLIGGVPCHVIRVHDTYGERRKAGLQVLDEIIGQAQLISTFWIDTESHLVRKYRIRTIRVNGNNTYYDVFLSPNDRWNEGLVCDRCCE